MYGLSGYGQMIRDTRRVEAYSRALRETVRPGSVVVEIGTGAGVLALLACRYGARRVYAIEYDDIISVAREIAVENGLADRIDFIQQFSTDVNLPEQADIVVSDIRGVLPLFAHHLPSIIDARTRLLKANGILIPHRDTVWATVVEAAEFHEKEIGAWERDSQGFEMSAAGNLAANRWLKARFNPEQLLVSPRCWIQLDYHTIKEVNARSELQWTVLRRANAHGICLWFDAELTDRVSFSNSPDNPELIYGSAFFPWPEAVPVEAGDGIVSRLRADLVGEDYVWSWNSKVTGGADGRTKADFRQSQFFGAPLSAQRLRKAASSYIPSINEEGAIDRLALNSMDGHTSVEEIARRLCEKFPSRFPNIQPALTHAGELAAKFSL